MFACQLYLVVLNVFAIDSIEVHIGNINFAQHDISDIQGEVQLQVDSGAKFSATAEYLKHKTEVAGHTVGNRWQASAVLNTAADLLLKDYQSLSGDRAEWKVSGDVRINVSLTGSVNDYVLKNIQYKASVKDLSGELADTGVAFESLNFRMQGNVRRLQPRIIGNTELNFQSGLLAVKDLLIEPLAGPIRIKTRFDADSRDVRLIDFNLEDPGGVNAHIPALRVDTGDYLNKHHLRLNIDIEHLSYVYRAWLQPLLYDSVLDDLETEGRLKASVVLSNREFSQLSLDLNDVSLSDKAGRFSLYQLSSQLRSTRNFERGVWSLSWHGAELYQLLLGPTVLDFEIDDKDISIASPLNIPLYDGELRIFKLSIKDLHSESPVVDFDGILTPVSLSSLSDAMGWPVMKGSISGVIPAVRYDRTGLKVDGTLLAKAFDGTFKIQHLEVSNLLSPIPRLAADFSVDQLDLERLTQTFDFGRIEGRLSGYVAGLKMLAWQAEEFDAFFFTPENDDSRHIISQRAVDNLTSLSGSDISSVLSRSYLRFFKNFRYDRLGIGCILRNNICRMNGIEPASGSAYYIVKSGLLPPRLDIIGYSHEVDWNDLMGRLSRVMSDNAPIIQ